MNRTPMPARVKAASVMESRSSGVLDTPHAGHDDLVAHSASRRALTSRELARQMEAP
jgi:hypothetical protein